MCVPTSLITNKLQIQNTGNVSESYLLPSTVNTHMVPVPSAIVTTALLSVVDSLGLIWKAR